ncbi:LOW QUALITY PROTEIN: Protein phosphatase 1 regulatory subunit 26 [Plecturocebus cupreus]
MRPQNVMGQWMKNQTQTKIQPSHCRNPTKNRAKVARRWGLMGAHKELAFRKPPHEDERAAQKPQVEGHDHARERGQNEASSPCHPSEAAQNKSEAKRSAGAVRRGKPVTSAAQAREASNSSSDDHIEEAVQVYQLQKTRKEANGDLPQRAQLREEREPDSRTQHKQRHKKPTGKHPARSSQWPPRPRTLARGAWMLTIPPKLRKETKAPPPASPASRSEFAEPSSGQAGTSAEFMRGEAILDISKTILSTPWKAATGPCPQAHSSTLRTCLPALMATLRGQRRQHRAGNPDVFDPKAQSGSLLARGEGCTSCRKYARKPTGTRPRGPSSEERGHLTPPHTAQAALQKVPCARPTGKHPTRRSQWPPRPRILIRGAWTLTIPRTLPKETKAPPPTSPASRSEFVELSSGRARTSSDARGNSLGHFQDDSAHPVEGSDRPLSASPLFYYPNMPSRCDGESCSVNSDEQEIRTSLTLKAQSGSLLARGESCPQAALVPFSPPGHNSQTSGPKPPLKH